MSGASEGNGDGQMMTSGIKEEEMGGTEGREMSGNGGYKRLLAKERRGRIGEENIRRICHTQ